MDARRVKSISKQMDQSGTPQVLLDGGSVRHYNAAAYSLMPSIEIGASVEAVFGDRAELIQEASEDHVAVFSGEFGPVQADFKLILEKGGILVEVHPTQESLSAAALGAIATSMITALTTSLGVTSKLLPVIEAHGSEKDNKGAAELNKSHYCILHIANQLRNAATTQNQRFYIWSRINICAWMEKIYEELLPLCQLADRKLVLKTPPRDYMCQISESDLERAILSLISNSIKFTEPGSEITLSLTKLNRDRLRISVIDRGCGISTADMTMILRGKERQAAIRDPRWGIGLGLPLVREVMNAHEGTVMVESKAGEGTAVHLSLRLSPGDLEYTLRSDVVVPRVSSGYPPLLVELADVLPAEAFEIRNLT